MRLVHMAASAALLLSSSALFAQQIPLTYDHVFLDVGGTPVRVTAEQAAKACGLDEAGVRQAAASRLEGSGIDAAKAQELYAAVDNGTMGTTGAGMTGTTGMATANTTGSAGTTGATGMNAGDTDMAAANTSAQAGTTTGTTDMAASNTGTHDMTGVLEGAQTTAAETTTHNSGANATNDASRNEEMLKLAVCRIDTARAHDLGITGIGQETTHTSG